MDKTVFATATRSKRGGNACGDIRRPISPRRRVRDGSGVCLHLAENQSFIDGNKRVALNAALVFLGLNGWDIDDPEELLYDAMIGISARTFTKQQLTTLLERLARPYTDE